MDVFIDKIVEVPVYVDVIEEIPVEVIKEVENIIEEPVERIVEKPVYVDKHVDVHVDVKVEVPKIRKQQVKIYVDKEIYNLMNQNRPIQIDNYNVKQNYYEIQNVIEKPVESRLE